MFVRWLLMFGWNPSTGDGDRVLTVHNRSAANYGKHNCAADDGRDNASVNDGVCADDIAGYEAERPTWRPKIVA